VRIFPFRAAQDFLAKVLSDHVNLTGSARAARVLADLPDSLSRFYAVVPASETKNELLSEASLECSCNK